MSPPSQREIELETLVRERDKTVADLSDEVNRLRKYLTRQPPPSRSEPVSLPPALLALLQPHINGKSKSTSGSTSSSTMTTALIQRTRVLQEENDELYELLRSSETGKLKEEVRSLKRVVSRLERALSDSDSVIISLSSELDSSMKDLQKYLKFNDTSRRRSRSPSRDSPQATRHSGSGLKPIPTGPRAYKKPRLSENQPSPARSNISLPPSNPSNTTSNGNRNRPQRRDISPRAPSNHRRSPIKDSRMDIDGHLSPRNFSQREASRQRGERDRDRGRNRDTYRDNLRENQRDRDRIRDKDRERDRTANDRYKEKDRDRSRRNGAQSTRGNGGGGGGGGGRKGGRPYGQQDSGDRTLAERMGL